MVKTTTPNLELEIEDEQEAVDNSYINRNFSELDTVINYIQPEISTTAINDNHAIQLYESTTNFATTKPKLKTLTALYNWIKTKLGSEPTTNLTVSDIVDNLTSTATNKVLSAKQGKILNDNLTSGLNSKAPTTHATPATTYGVGNATNYGHVKTINNVTTSSTQDGLALAANQGKVLDDKITALENTKESIDNVDTKVAARAPTNHASGGIIYGRGTTTLYGHVK